MADEEGEVRGIDEEEWGTPADLDGLVDGASTIIVGGFSTIQTVTDALSVINPGDIILVLAGTYKQSVAIDDRKHAGVEIRGDTSVDASKVAFDGTLKFVERPVVKNKSGDNETEKALPPPILSHLSFQQGAEFQALTNGLVDDCIFGTEENVSVVRVVRAHAFSTVKVTRSRIIGGEKSAVYGFPRSQVKLENCKITGPKSNTGTVGVFLDDSPITVSQSTISGFEIGVYAADKCKGSSVDNCQIFDISCVGYLADAGTVAALRGSTIKDCGREAVVITSGAHPILRNSNFIGDVRAKRNSVLSGVFDCTITAPGQLIDEDGTFEVRGFKVVDPSKEKPRGAKPKA